MKETHLKIIETIVIILGILGWILFMLQLLGFADRIDLFWWHWEKFPAVLFNPADHTVSWIIINAFFAGILIFKLKPHRIKEVIKEPYGIGRFFYEIFLFVAVMLILNALVPLIWLLFGRNIPPFMP